MRGDGSLRALGLCGRAGVARSYAHREDEGVAAVVVAQTFLVAERGPDGLAGFHVGEVEREEAQPLLCEKRSESALPARLLVSPARSEERRVGKECRSRWSRYH